MGVLEADTACWKARFWFSEFNEVPENNKMIDNHLISIHVNDFIHISILNIFKNKKQNKEWSDISKTIVIIYLIYWYCLLSILFLTFTCYFFT